MVQRWSPLEVPLSFRFVSFCVSVLQALICPHFTGDALIFAASKQGDLCVHMYATPFAGHDLYFSQDCFSACAWAALCTWAVVCAFSTCIPERTREEMENKTVLSVACLVWCFLRLLGQKGNKTRRRNEGEAVMRQISRRSGFCPYKNSFSSYRKPTKGSGMWQTFKNSFVVGEG